MIFSFMMVSVPASAEVIGRQERRPFGNDNHATLVDDLLQHTLLLLKAIEQTQRLISIENEAIVLRPAVGHHEINHAAIDPALAHPLLHMSSGLESFRHEPLSTNDSYNCQTVMITITRFH